jgi:hypothetical protein
MIKEITLLTWIFLIQFSTQILWAQDNLDSINLILMEQNLQIQAQQDSLIHRYCDTSQYFSDPKPASNRAQEKLNDYLAAHPDSSLMLMQMRIDLAEAENNWYQLSGEQLNSLQLIASNPLSSEYNKANAVLDLVNHNPLPEFEMPIDYGAELRLAQQQGYATLPRALMSLSPNPSNGLVYVAYELPREYNSAILVMHNALGQTIAEWDISASPVVYQLNCEGYPSGLYSISLMVDGMKIETQKLSLITK